MSVPFCSLSAVAGTGAGAVLDVGGVTNDVTIQVTTTGSPTNYDIYVQGSLDGAGWFYIPNTSVTFEPGASYAATVVGNGDYTVDTTPMQFRMPSVRFLRAYVNSLTGGTSPTVTAWLAVGQVNA